MGAFEDFVNVELPLRVAIASSPAASTFPRFTGVGKTVEALVASAYRTAIGASGASWNANWIQSILVVAAGAAAGKVLYYDASNHLVFGDHGSIAGLTDDDHAQYLRHAGRTGGQTQYGGTGASEDLTLKSTAHATKGTVNIGDSGDIEVGDGSDTELRPNTDDDVSLGTTDKRWSHIWGHLLHVKTSTANVSGPPTDAELDAEFGEPATIGDGCLFFIDDSGAGTAGWLVATINGAWWGASLSKLT